MAGCGGHGRICQGSVCLGALRPVTVRRLWQDVLLQGRFGAVRRSSWGVVSSGKVGYVRAWHGTVRRLRLVMVR